MTLDDYLKTPGSLTVAQLRARIGVSSDAQIRQWQHGYAGRAPSAEYAKQIQIATGGKVMVWDTRPDDWFRVWPELIGTKGAPAVKAKA